MSLFGKVLDFLFPRSCELCGGETDGGMPICGTCREKFLAECFEHCPVCGRTALRCECGADFTAATRTSLGGRRFFTLMFYRSEKAYGESDRVSEKLIFSLKENGRTAGFFAGEIARGLGRLLGEAGEDAAEWIITYPPRSAEKLYKCGFDQSELMAKKLAAALGCRAERTMIRGGRSAEQKTLGREDRAANAEETLIPLRRNIKDGGKYILIDDIITSGATVTAAARLLYGCGAAEVIPVSAARTMPRGK